MPARCEPYRADNAKRQHAVYGAYGDAKRLRKRSLLKQARHLCWMPRMMFPAACPHCDRAHPISSVFMLAVQDFHDLERIGPIHLQINLQVCLGFVPRRLHSDTTETLFLGGGGLCREHSGQ